MAIIKCCRGGTSFISSLGALLRVCPVPHPRWARDNGVDGTRAGVGLDEVYRDNRAGQEGRMNHPHHRGFNSTVATDAGAVVACWSPCADQE